MDPECLATPCQLRNPDGLHPGQRRWWCPQHRELLQPLVPRHAASSSSPLHAMGIKLNLCLSARGLDIMDSTLKLRMMCIKKRKRFGSGCTPGSLLDSLASPNLKTAAILLGLGVRHCHFFGLGMRLCCLGLKLPTSCQLRLTSAWKTNGKEPQKT